MDVSELMNREPHAVGVETSISDAAQLMKSTGASCLVVMRDNKVEGIITDRDMALGCLVDGHVSWKCQVYKHMTLQRQTVSPSLHFGDASIMMIDRDMDHLPVMEDGQLVGLISSGQLFQAIDREMATASV
jgi:signal-transduction protein with cAMP-binding, CBS, and nucleotidyltransferase domain